MSKYKYDFVILTAPRSGSHMLATALDCHPDLNFCGEVDIKHNDTGNEIGDKRNFAIVHAHSYEEWKEYLPNKIIVLYRDSKGRNSSYGKKPFLDRDRDDYCSSLHYRQPTIHWLIKELDYDKMEINPKVRDDQDILDNFLKVYSEHLFLRYEEITKDSDIRIIPKKFSDMINNYLDIKNPVDFIPKYYKPELKRYK